MGRRMGLAITAVAALIVAVVVWMVLQGSPGADEVTGCTKTSGQGEPEQWECAKLEDAIALEGDREKATAKEFQLSYDVVLDKEGRYVVEEQVLVR